MTRFPGTGTRRSTTDFSNNCNRHSGPPSSLLGFPNQRCVCTSSITAAVRLDRLLPDVSQKTLILNLPWTLFPLEFTFTKLRNVSFYNDGSKKNFTLAEQNRLR